MSVKNTRSIRPLYFRAGSNAPGNTPNMEEPAPASRHENYKDGSMSTIPDEIKALESMLKTPRTHEPQYIIRCIFNLPECYLIAAFCTLPREQ
jgi:hypothetical protein